MAELVAEGKVRALGLSEVDVPDARARRGDPSGHRAAVRALALDARRARRRAALVHRARRRVRAVRAARPRVPDRAGSRSTRPSARATSAAGTRASSPMPSRRTRPSSSGAARSPTEISATPAQVAIAWVLAQGENVVPIPGTKRVRYLEENVGAAALELGADALARLDARARARGNALLTMRPSPLRSELEAAGAVFAERSGDEVARRVRRSRGGVRRDARRARGERSQRPRVRRGPRPRRRQAAAVAGLERRRRGARRRIVPRLRADAEGPADRRPAALARGRRRVRARGRARAPGRAAGDGAALSPRRSRRDQRRPRPARVDQRARAGSSSPRTCSSPTGRSDATCSGTPEAVVGALARPASRRARARSAPTPTRSRASRRASPASAPRSTRPCSRPRPGLVERAVSFTKGCYVGQEPVARLHYRGHPNRHLRTLVSFDALPTVPAELTLGDRVVGRLTSVVQPPGDAPAVGLGYVRREVEEGAIVDVLQAVGGPAHARVGRLGPASMVTRRP